MSRAAHRVWEIGLTGGIGSGKSTVAALWAQWGAEIVDADAVAHELTRAEGAAMPQIVQTFGAQVQASDGGLDRVAMRALAFTQTGARESLQAILHPLIARTMTQRAEQARLKGAEVVVFDIPLLVESGRWASQLDAVVVVDCLPDTQVERVCQRSQLSVSEVQNIMRTQVSRERRLRAADVVIFNERISLAQLQCEVQAVAQYFGMMGKTGTVA